MSANSYQLIISKAGEPPREISLHEGTYRIGRSRKCEVLLEHISVSSQHAQITLKGESVVFEDLGSTNGTYVDDARLLRPIELNSRHVARVGEYNLQLKLFLPKDGSSFKSVSIPPPEAALRDPLEEVPPFHSISFEQPVYASSLEPSLEAPFSEEQKRRRELYRMVRQEIHEELFKRLDLKRLMVVGLKDEELSSKARKAIDEIIDGLGDKTPKNLSRGQLAKDVYDEAMGWGPLESLLADSEVTEIMVNGASSIYYQKKGRLILSESQFLDDQQLLGIIERMVAPLGCRIEESQPMLDVRLKEGLRLNVIIPPLSINGPCITIRKFSKMPCKISDLMVLGSLTPEMGEFFKICVQLRKNIFISGGVGSGKTALLNVMSNFLPATERIVTIEEVAELRLKQHHVLSLETRAPDNEGKRAVTIRDLIRNVLRMRPDRVVIGECCGGALLDVFQFMNSGRDGLLTTICANSPQDALARMEAMILMKGPDLPAHVIRERLASAVHLIVQQERFSDGTRKITRVSEIVGMEHDTIRMQDLFKYVRTGIDEKGVVLGNFRATGCLPSFMGEIKARGLKLDPCIFDRMDESA